MHQNNSRERINMIDHELKIMLVSLYFCTGFKLLILSFFFFNLKTKCMPLFLPGKPCFSWPGLLPVGSHLSPEFHIASGTTEESRQWVQNRPQFPPDTHLQGFNHGPDFLKKIIIVKKMMLKKHKNPNQHLKTEGG